MKNSKTLKNVIEVLTAFIYFCGFMWLHWSSIYFPAWAFSKISFNQVACPLMRMASSSFPNIHNLSGSCSSH